MTRATPTVLLTLVLLSLFAVFDMSFSPLARFSDRELQSLSLSGLRFTSAVWCAPKHVLAQLFERALCRRLLL
jgi:hypothetical protein